MDLRPLAGVRRGSHDSAVNWRILLAYAVLYVVWGSTYLAMKIAVTSLPAFTAASLRFVFSGVLLLGWGLATTKERFTQAHLKTSVLQGLLLLVLGNASVMWAMKTVPSGVGALIIGATPLFMALFGGDRRRTTWIGIVVGVVGIGVLVDPFHDHADVPLTGALLLIVAAAAWAFGSLLPRKMPIHPSNAVATGAQMLTGAIVQAGIAVAMGERLELATVTSTSLWAVAYLALFGSLIGFSAYGWLMRVEPAARVSTYAFVNPVVAVLLGALLGNEPLSARVVLAAVVIVGAVVLIVRPPRLLSRSSSSSSSS